MSVLKPTISIENHISTEEIISSLQTVNGVNFHISDLNDYAGKVLKYGKALVVRDEGSGILSYILYYDNEPTIFITMVYTNENYQGRGLAKKLLSHLIKNSRKEIQLEVNPQNPARKLYRSLKFEEAGKNGDNIIMRFNRRLAIMQPYSFPYIGYFHLCEASEKIVFYDDVSFIKGGWINRNRILLNNSAFLFTIPVVNASSFRFINDTAPKLNKESRSKFFGQIESAYKKAPNYYAVKELLNGILEQDYNNIADLAIQSIVKVYEFLGKEVNYTRSSVCSPETRGLEKAERLIAITKGEGYTKYINLGGGKELYSKDYFTSNGVQLNFVKSQEIKYHQFSRAFIPGLSIIDVLMFNDKDSVKNQLLSFGIE